ncbi:hypothetical protein B0H13DRAFT_2313554 [Mycena leptocephala]|nr:hypothetical protein B0H13DRAFT_2313554 [Mycena leptocephala]
MQNAESDQYQVPIELERAIFEMAADNRPLSIPTFMLVARRVKKWFAASNLYFSVILSLTSHLELDRCYIERFQGLSLFRIDILLDMIQYGKFPSDDVRNLLIQVDCDRATLLSACPKTENLWINPDLGPNLFHLEILDNMEYNSEYDPKMLPDLALIPHLSHLAFAYVEGFIDFFLPLPNTCKSLRVLVALDPYVHTIIAHHKDKEELARDERFVVM